MCNFKEECCIAICSLYLLTLTYQKYLGSDFAIKLIFAAFHFVKGASLGIKNGHHWFTVYIGQRFDL
jgi:hypothetical protein